MNKIKYRLTKAIYMQMMNDLARSHDYASERVGFLFTRSKALENGDWLIVATAYIPVADDHYIQDHHVGARINSDAIRIAMQKARSEQCGVFHIHLHEHKGKPSMSRTDREGIPPMIESFKNVAPDQCHGIFILSENSVLIEVMAAQETEYRQPELTTIVGYPCQYFFSAEKNSKQSGVYDRQSFLGPNAQYLFENVRVGIIGYGGGGSHVGLQLAHIGLTNQVIFDDDHIEDSNLNRLVGGWAADLKTKTQKSEIAKRTILNVLPTARVEIVNSRWQDNPEKLQQCDLVIGCVDSYLEREQLEAESRRYLIPLIDIGMDVHSAADGFSMSGQILLSMPGGPCMRCMKFITEENLTKEAAKYGNIGGRPQVIWPNGVLASTAVGIVVDIVSGWTGRKDANIYLAYDGNTGIISEHVRLKYVPTKCLHYPLADVGPPRFVCL